jgi:hypothetical protein
LLLEQCPQVMPDRRVVVYHQNSNQAVLPFKIRMQSVTAVSLDHMTRCHTSWLLVVQLMPLVVTPFPFTRPLFCLVLVFLSLPMSP